ncbi:MAG: anthranilate synthase component I [bacterium]|nr:anthranilate synthase component I [bacterium]
MKTRRATLHVREFVADTLTPVAVYERLAALSPVRFLFESVTGGEQVSRYSFLGAGPRALIRLDADGIELEREGSRQSLEGDPLVALDRVLSEVHCDRSAADLPFTGGYVGFFGFDLIRLAERLPSRPRDAFGLPTAILGRFDHLVIFDHASQRVLAVANEIEGEVSEQQARQDLAELSEVLGTTSSAGAVPMPETLEVSAEAVPSLGDDEYRAAVARAKEFIAAGDIFQVVLARHFRMSSERLSPRALYRALRAVNPSPYMVLLELPEVALVGGSPEMLVRKTGSRLETRPIAGTRRRGASPEEDRALADELVADQKERAEHVMLVDLGRNDIGRVAAPGTVKVSTFMEVERYSHVMHLVSKDEGDEDAGTAPQDALLACFPAGTVSGAPKIRAIEIIDELEPEARGPYAGAVGYVSFSGDLDTCITIRTLVVCGEEVSVTAGAGIVADSDPVREEEETRHKAAALLSAVELAKRLGS